MLKKKAQPQKVKQQAIYELNATNLIETIADGSDYTKSAVKDICSSFLEELRKSIADGHTVSLHRIGTFSTIVRKPRIGRNPKTGESLEIPAKRGIKFKISVGIKRAVGDLGA